jgi:hypothetical protein
MLQIAANRIYLTLVTLLLVALAGVAVYKVWPLLHPQVVAVAPLNPACDLHRAPCVAHFPAGGQVQLDIEPHSLPVVQPLRLAVLVKGLEADRVEVDFRGVSMDMGFNRPQLRAEGGGRFSGEGMLPVCVRSHMAWEARVLLHTAHGLLAAPFRFETTRPGAAPAP